MVRPGSNGDVTAQAGLYYAEAAAVVGDGDRLPLHSADAVGKLAALAAGVVTEARQRLNDSERAASTLFESFIPALVEARSAAHDIAVTDGEFTNRNDASLEDGGNTFKDAQGYFAPFKLASDADLPPDVPTVNLSVIPRMVGAGLNGGDAYLARYGYGSLLESGTNWPGFSEDFSVPVLVDPTQYTLEAFTALQQEAADGYAAQVADAWRAIQQEERDHPSFTGEPLVLRMLAVLPVPPSEEVPDHMWPYLVDFLPQITKAKADANIKRAYDARLLVKGNPNLGADYLKYEFGNSPNPVYADVNGKRAPLTVSRADKIEADAAESFDDLTRTPRSQGALAIYLAPHVLKENAFEPAYLGGGGWGDGPVTMGGGVTRSAGSVGGASIATGPASSYIGSGKRNESFLSRVAPELNGRPIIISMQLVTLQR